jgi:hypothetical protein
MPCCSGQAQTRYPSDLPSAAVGGAAMTVSTALLAIPAVLTAGPTWLALDVLAARRTLVVACTELTFWCFYPLGPIARTSDAVRR